MLQGKVGRSRGRGHHNAWRIYGSAASLTRETSWDMIDGSLGEIRTRLYPLLEHPSPALSPPLPHAFLSNYVMTCPPRLPACRSFSRPFHEQEKQRVPKPHICVTLHDSVAARISKKPFNLPCAIGVLPAGSWAQEPLAGSGLHHPSPFLAEASNIDPRPSQMPLCFQPWAKHQESR